MDIRWVTAFVDIPADRFAQGVDFWRTVTGSRLSPFRGDQDQFATLLPPTGDPYLKVQRLDVDVPRIHLDLHVDPDATSMPAAVEQAAAIGAEVVSVAGHAVLRSPGGLTFCLVEHLGGTTRSDPLPQPESHLVDQVCIDVGFDQFEAEVAFWSELTGWAANSGSREEFVALERPTGQPLRILVQRLGADDAGSVTRAHLDLACGPHRHLVAEHHAGLGAEVGVAGAMWVTMTDPVGMVYCVTGRDPVTGLLPKA